MPTWVKVTDEDMDGRLSYKEFKTSIMNKMKEEEDSEQQ